MAKEDIKSAFRLLPIHPDDFELLGVKFEGKYYIDKCLPMGVRCAPAYFETFSTFIEYCARKRSQCENIIHYVDDFLCVGSTHRERVPCHKMVQALRDVCTELGVPLAKEKSEGPTTCLTFLGLELDSVKMQVRVPLEKIQEIKREIHKTRSTKSATIRKIQSLVGKLNFVCRAVRPGRAFLRRLIDMTKGQTRGDKQVVLSEGAKEDLGVWLEFLEGYNGVSVIPQEGWLNDEDIDLYTDASGEIGYGGYLNGKWFNGKWPSHDIIRTTSIAWKEMIPIVIALMVWGEELSDKRIVLHTDNMAVKCAVNKQTSPCPQIMALLRKLVITCLVRNISIKAVHVPTQDNGIADSLSRFQVDRFRKLAPRAEEHPTPTPAGTWQI